MLVYPTYGKVNISLCKSHVKANVSCLFIYNLIDPYHTIKKRKGNLLYFIRLKE